MKTAPDATRNSRPTQVDESSKPTTVRKPRIGSMQGRILGLLLVATDTGRSKLSVVDLTSWLPEDTEASELRYVRGQYKKALAALAKKFLIKQVGTTVSLTGQATGDVVNYLGKRVPKGYSRTVATFKLTEAGRMKAMDLQQTLTKEELSFLTKTVRKL